MATLWIDDNLVIRWHPNGWPEYPPKPGPMSHQEFFTEYYEDDLPAYHKSLEQAKSESLLVEYANGEPVTNVGGKPDSFFEVNGDVEVVDQWYNNRSGQWVTASEDACWRMANGGAKTRQVARLKPAPIDLPTLKIRGEGFHIDKPPKPARSAMRFTEPITITEPAWIKNDGLKHLILKEFEKLMGTRPNSVASLNEALNNLGIK